MDRQRRNKSTQRLRDTPELSQRIRKLFHWNFSAVLIPFFWGCGLSMVGVAVSTSDPDQVFWLAYVCFILAALWTLGYWLTVDIQKALPSSVIVDTHLHPLMPEVPKRHRRLVVSLAIVFIASLALIATRHLQITNEDDSVFYGLSASIQSGNDLRTTLIVFTNNSRLSTGEYEVGCLVKGLLFKGGGGIGGINGSKGIQLDSVPPQQKHLHAGGDAQTYPCIPAFMKIPEIACADIEARIAYTLSTGRKSHEKRFRYIAHNIEGKNIWLREPLDAPIDDCRIRKQ